MDIGVSRRWHGPCRTASLAQPGSNQGRPNNNTMDAPCIPIGLVALTGLWFLIAAPAAGQGTTFSKIEQGRYLVKAGDCASCHTDDEGQPFAGGRPLPTPAPGLKEPRWRIGRAV